MSSLKPEISQNYFALANYWRQRADTLRRECAALREELVELRKQLSAQHAHQWTDVTTIADLATGQQRHACGCGASKISPV